MCPTRHTRAVLLDLDDTLIVEETHAMAQIRATAALAGADPEGWDRRVLEAARAEWYSYELHPVCQELGIASWEGLWATFEGAHPKLAQLREFAPRYAMTTWTSALESAGLDTGLAPEMARRYVELQRAGHPLAAGADLLVSRATSLGPVALVTNGPPDIQRHKISQTGYSPKFAAVLISGELGIGKPDPEVFRHAVRTIGALPEETVMVGDSWERDVEGALSAGLRAVWISHGRDVPRRDPNVLVAHGPGDVDFASFG
jgi:putative hydrolase of the HAD superfamily